MNKKTITFIKNFSYTLSSNLVSLLISTLVILIVPKLIGVKDYGYWQLYLFYSSYIGFLHFGWNDGIYLRYGGKEYKDLEENRFFSQFWMLVIFQFLIGTFIILFTIFFFFDSNKIFIVEMTIFCMLISNSRLMLIYVLQCTNRIKEYAQITMLERIIYCFLIMLFLFLGIRQYKVLVIADLIGKLSTLFYATYCCKGIVFNKVSMFYFDIKETWLNISVGIKLMFANIASFLIIGIVRFGIERTWSVSTFGRVSLVLSISNLMMIFINAIGIVIFPILKRTNEGKLPTVYATMRSFLMVPLLGLLIVYYPIKVILPVWLPKYTEGLIYMALLFPMCIYEGKMALLINTYLKTLRKEKMILVINLASVILSVILTILFTALMKNLSLALVSIVVLLAFRSALAEIFLSKLLNISVYTNILLEIGMTLIFILVSWFVQVWNGFEFYLFFYGLYLLIKRKEIKETTKSVFQIVRR